MLFLKYILATWLLFAAVTNAQSDQGSMISYNAIALLNQTTFKSMVVIVDSISYPLEANKTFPILFSGKAPSAKSGYHYAKVYASDNSTLAESFERQPVNQSTPHEFFNRTWNTHNNAQLPQVYPPLSSIHRIKSDLHRDNEIPTIHIIGNQTEFDQMKGNTTVDISAKTTISYLSLHDAFKFDKVELSLAGESARWVLKKSFNVKLHKEDRLYGYKDFKLRSLAYDPSYIREQLGYDILKSAGLISSEFSFVRVFMNNEELGLYGIIDTFKGPWLSNVFADGDSSYKHGYLYQAKSYGANNHISDLSYYENITAYADGEYKIKEEATDREKDNYQPLMDLTKFIAKAPINSSDAFKEWNEILDMDSVLRSMTIEILGGYSDGYIAKANNFYVYQNPNSDQYIYIAADLDLCLGNTYDNMSDLWSGNYSTFPYWGTRPLTNQIMRGFRMKFSIIASALLVASVVNARPFMTNEEGTIAPLFVPPKVETVQDSYIIILKNHLAGQEIEEHAQWINTLVKENQKDEMMLDWLNPHLTSHGIEHVYDTPFIKGYAGRFDENILNAIRQSEDVEYIEKDSLVYANELQRNAPWGLARVSHKDSLTFKNYENYEHDPNGGEGVKVYVIDTGINVDHVDFNGRATWGHTVPSGDVDADGNGHGSHCAGTIAGGRYGIAKKAEPVAVKVLRSNGSGTMSDVVKGVDWATAEHIKAKALARKDGKKYKGAVANMSLGGGRSPTLDRFVNGAVQAGIVFSVAAGNDNDDACDYSPAAAELAITVGASTIKDERAYFSNYGKCVDVFAPGYNILSIWKGSRYATNTISGTSMAAPHVAGLAAYYLSLEEDATAEKIKEKILSTATKDILDGIPSDTPNLLINNGVENNNTKKKIIHGIDSVLKDFFGDI